MVLLGILIPMENMHPLLLQTWPADYAFFLPPSRCTNNEDYL
jgi:hypothetical protein